MEKGVHFYATGSQVCEFTVHCPFSIGSKLKKEMASLINYANCWNRGLATSRTLTKVCARKGKRQSTQMRSKFKHLYYFLYAKFCREKVVSLSWRPKLHLSQQNRIWRETWSTTYQGYTSNEAQDVAGNPFYEVNIMLYSGVFMLGIEWSCQGRLCDCNHTWVSSISR